MRNKQLRDFEYKRKVREIKCKEFEKCMFVMGELVDVEAQFLKPLYSYKRRAIHENSKRAHEVAKEFHSTTYVTEYQDKLK